MLRLLNLSSWGLLNNPQAVKATQLAWSRKGTNGLPELTNLNAIGYVLRFADAPGIDAVNVVKQFILSLKPTTATKDLNGKRVLAVDGGWRQQFIHECIVVTRQIVSFHGEPLTGVEWTADESNALYDKALTWWEVDKAAIQTEEQRKSASPFGENPVISEASRLDDFFRLVVLPYSQWTDTTQWNRLFKWIIEMRTLAVFATSCYPYILLQRPTESERFATEMLSDLDSSNEAAVVGAAEGIRYWAHLAASRRIPVLDANLVDAFVQRIALRRMGRIEYCLSIFTHLLNEKPELFNIDQISLLVSSLEPWNQSTSLIDTAISQDGFPMAKRPTLRSRVGGLAGAIQRWYRIVAPTACIPRHVVAWEMACAKDPLPEVHLSFNEWENP